MPRWLKYTLVVLVILSWVPVALIARARASRSTQPRVHLVRDMDNQLKFKAQAANPLFADGRAMRPPVEGTVPLGSLEGSEELRTGRLGEAWVVDNPLPVTMSLMRRGQQRYDIYCAPCHGLVGDGDGPVAQRADQLQEGTWVPPTSLHTDVVRQYEDGRLFAVITNGVRNMPPYGPQISVDDRWAIVAYMRALQRSQAAGVDDVPSELRAQLR